MRSDICQLSVRYQVLTSETAFVGVIKQDDKTVEELVKVVLPTSISA